MIVLDTDHMSLLERPTNPVSERLRDKLSDIGPEGRCTTIISYEEQVRGWTAYLSKARTVAQLIENYRRLRIQLENYCVIEILEFDELAATRYQELRRQGIKVGSMDLRITAIVLARNATLLSRNLKDFRKVPGLRVEDWTKVSS